MYCPGVRKADTVAEDVMRRIVRGEWAVGSILPREDGLATLYGVNRGVIREAIKLLEGHRLVRPVRRRGTEVLDPLRSLSPEVLHALLVPEPGKIDRTVLEGLLEVRAELDVKMSVLAAERRTKADLDRLDAALARARDALKDPNAYAERSPDVALAVAQATQNPVFQMLAHWNRVVSRDLDELFRIVRPANEAHLQGMTVLVELVRKKDVAAIEQVTRAFHAWATPRLVAAAELASGPSYPHTAPPATKTPTKRPTKPKRREP
jgi:DNA-binding FadR family transcriptional regulator